MEKPEIQDYISDVVRKVNDPSIQALTNLIKNIQDQQKEHKEEEIRSRLAYRDEMLTAVENKIKIVVPEVVNGKIDKLTVTVKSMQEDVNHIKKAVQDFEPVREQYEDRKGFWKTLGGIKDKSWIIIGIVGGIGLILGYLLKFYGH